MTEIKVPGFPESVTDGTIVAWHKKPGDAVRREENLVDIETDKVMFEVPAPVDGTLEEVFEQEGATVVAGQLLARITAGAAAPADAAQAAGPAPAGGAPQQVRSGAADAIVAPAAERLMAEHGLDAREVVGTGRGGRVLKEDVLRHLGAVQAGDPGAEAAEPEVPRHAPESRPVVEFPGSGRPEKRVPMSRLRARVAERLVEAQRTAAILSTFNEINMHPVNEIRRRHRERFEQEYGIRLGYMSFFIKAAVEALKRFPVINASIDGQEIIYHGYFDIGIAVASPRGLVVPIVRDADQLDMAEIEQQIAVYAQKARDSSLSLEEISGGTFTITNGGVFGSLLSTPILNPPQSAILGMHKIQDRAVVENGAIVVRPMMYVALSYDHRLIDGSEAVQFLVGIKEFLEDPARMLLAV